MKRTVALGGTVLQEHAFSSSLTAVDKIPSEFYHVPSVFHDVLTEFYHVPSVFYKVSAIEKVFEEGGWIKSGATLRNKRRMGCLPMMVW